MTNVLKEPVSPCLGICRLDPGMTHCVGCLRTIEELRDWIGMSRDEKYQLLEELARRQATRED